MSSAGSNEPVPRQGGIIVVLRHDMSFSTSCDLNFLAVPILTDSA